MTLIEVLVVLTLIAVSAGVVTLALPGTTSQRSVTQEAELLASRLNIAAERSLIEGRHFKFEWSAQDYAFYEWMEEEWRDTDDPALADRAALDQGAVLTDGDGTRRGTVIITPDLLPPDTGALVLRLMAGSVRQGVTFDGFSARLKSEAP